MSAPEYWDVFISHATEDKDEIARPLAESLTKAGVRVWFDEFSLKIGQGISESINFGLANSVYGIVILSEYYLKKDWTKRELAGLFAKEQNEKIILPIWHQISLERIRNYSPILADRLAANSNIGIEKLTESILEVIRPNYHNLLLHSEWMGKSYAISSITVRQPLGLWHGQSGRLRLYEGSDAKFQVEGDYDWSGYEWAGHIVGNYSNGILRFYWWWDRSPERGSGYFLVDPVEHTLKGGWSDIDTGAGLLDNNEGPLPRLLREWIFDRVAMYFEDANTWKK